MSEGSTSASTSTTHREWAAPGWSHLASRRRPRRGSPLWKFDAETSQTYRGTPGGDDGLGSRLRLRRRLVLPCRRRADRGRRLRDGELFVPARHTTPTRTTRKDGGARRGHRPAALARRPADDLKGRDARIADPQRDADFGASPNLFRIGGRPVVGEAWGCRLLRPRRALRRPGQHHRRRSRGLRAVRLRGRRLPRHTRGADGIHRQGRDRRGHRGPHYLPWGPRPVDLGSARAGPVERSG